jgi:arginine:pyruvate transaminase
LGSSACISVAAPFERRRTLALEILKDFPQIHVTPPQGTMYLMLDIRSTGLNGEAFANALLEERKIAVMPGESFGAAAAGHIRVAMTVEDALFSKALTDLCDFASTLASK